MQVAELTHARILFLEKVCLVMIPLSVKMSTVCMIFTLDKQRLLTAVIFLLKNEMTG